MNDGAMAFGNHVVVVIVATACALRWTPARVGRRAIISCIGLYPRNAANNAIVGGMVERYGVSCGAPALVNAVDIALGKLVPSADTTSVNRTVNPTVVPVFCIVKSMPAAVLRRSGGTVPIIEDVFGEANMPNAIPIT